MDRKPYYGTEPRGRSAAPSSRPRSANRPSGSATPRPRSSSPAGSRDPYRRPPSGNSRPDPNRPDPNRPGANRPDSRYADHRNPPRRSDDHPQRKAPPRRRRRDPLAILIPLGMVVCLVIAVFYVGSAWFTASSNDSTYCSNVYINGIDVSDFTKDAGAQFVRDQIGLRLGKTYTLTWQDQSWSFSAADFGATIDTDPLMERAWNFGHVGNFFDRAKDIRSLKENPIYLEAPLSYDETQIDALVDTIYDAVYVAPVDAGVTITMDRPYLTSESSRGQELDKETLRAQIVSLVETGEGSQELPMIVLEPAISSETAASTMDVIVDYKTDTTIRGWNSRYNVRKALSYFNGLTVYPGDQVSFNEIVGPRTEERGWQSATEYIDNTTQEGFGGGVCQASSTLYGAVLKAGMTIIERHPHSMTVAYVEPSLDAAVTDTSKNLVFRNDTQHAIYIYTEVTKEYASVTIYGDKPDYRYELLSTIDSQDTTAVRVSYIDDTEGKFCYYETDAPVLYKKGRAACTSNGYLVAYDWETGLEVSRTWLSHDIYESGTDIYWKGVHSVNDVNASFTLTTATDLSGSDLLQ